MFVFLPWLLQNLIWLPTRIILDFFGHFKVRGLQNLRGISGPVIFVSNHTSEIDPILLPAALPWFSRFLPMFYVSREKSFYNIKQPLKLIFYGGFFFEIWGAYKALAGLHNYEASLKNHVMILNHGQSVMIFPEGSKSFDGNFHPEEVHGGAAFLSRKTGAPIVPIVISGAFKITPLNFLASKKHLIVTLGQPIYPKELFAGKIDIVPHDYKLAMLEVISPKIQEMLKQNP